MHRDGPLTAGQRAVGTALTVFLLLLGILTFLGTMGH